MAKVAMIGAGSVVFCKTLMSDIMATPTLEGTEFALMSRTEPKLRRMEEFGKRMLRDNGIRGSVWATLDRREAIRDADFVVVMIQVGGHDAFGIDYHIPLKYGVDQCIGDTLGPGGIFRGLRHIPVLAAIAKDNGVPDTIRARAVQVAGSLGVDASSAFQPQAQ